MRESKLKTMAYELKNLWCYLTKQELCDYYGVSERTLCNYKNKLNLGKNNTKEMSAGKTVKIYVKQDNKYVLKEFKSWQHFVVWEKAQSHSIKIDSITKNKIPYITCEFLSKKEDAKNYENTLNI